ncbi:MAG: TonB-dependent receptor [Candidatus Eremiobacteraeota bacterium]|nr:TonB-dependent receptor [Candidatus Eremiobacteraeota bacterium]
MNRHISLFIIILLLTHIPAFANQEPPEIEVETVVKATPLERYLVTTSVIKQKDIEFDPSLDVGELLEKSPGIIMRGVGNQKARNEVFIRGFDRSHLRVYLNRIPLNTPNDRYVDFSLIPKEFIKEVEIVRGPPPVSYGADASGGIINLVPRNGKDSTGITTRILVGSFQKSTYTITAGYNDSRCNLFITGKQEKSGGYTENTARNLDYAFFTGNFNLGNNYEIALLYSRTGGEKQAPNEINPNGTIRPHKKGFWTGSYNWSYKNINLENASFRLEKKNAGGLSWSLLVFNHIHRDTLTGWVDPGYPIKPRPGSPKQYYRAGTTNYSYWDSKNSGGSIDFDVELCNHKFKFGASAENIKFRQNENASLSRPMNEWDKDYWTPWKRLNYGGYYVQDEIKINPGIIMTLGGRVDTGSVSSAIGNWNANIVLTRGDDSWRFAGGSTGRFPTLKELEGKYGNPDLLPERATSWEIGYHHKADKTTLDFSVFTSSIKNLIAKPDRDSSYANWQRVKIFGYECNGRLPVSKSIFASAGIQYINRDFGDLPRAWDWDDIPKNKYTIGIESSVKPGNLNWKINWYSLSSRETGDTTYPTLSGYSLVNLMLFYETPETDTNKISQRLELIVRNLFDEKYQETLYYPAPGRGIWGEYAIRF